MAGPFQPHQGADPYLVQPLPYPESYGETHAADSRPAILPPPSSYPNRRRGRNIAAVLIGLAVVAGIVTAAVFAARDRTAGRPTLLTSATAQQAIQNYLDALSRGDIQAISRNTLCGLYDGVRDRRTDNALARMSSEAFQQQFSRADVVSVDTMVFTSPTSAQALFTMRVAPAYSRGGGEAERQAIAQLLTYHNEILVCSYVQRTAGTF
jgi:hypothetical protein